MGSACGVYYSNIDEQLIRLPDTANLSFGHGPPAYRHSEVTR
jgi:hypothetical protein